MGEKYGNIRIPGEVESTEFEMILDAAVEAKLETRILEEWYCRDENAVPPAYYLRPKSEMLKNCQNTVSHSHLLTIFFTIYYSGRQSPRPGTCCCLWIRFYSPVHTWTTAAVVLPSCAWRKNSCKTPSNTTPALMCSLIARASELGATVSCYG